MSRWPSFTFTSGSKTPSPPPRDEALEETSDLYRMLDPLYMNKKRDYGGTYSAWSPIYRDEEGIMHQPTCRPFPLINEPPKKPPPNERPAYFERVRLPPPEVLPPTYPTPKIPPWKLPPKPQPAPKKKPQHIKKSKAPKRDSPLRRELFNESVTNEEQEPSSTGSPGGNSSSEARNDPPLMMGNPEVSVSTSDTGAEGTEEGSQGQNLAWAKEVFAGMAQVVHGCFNAETEG